MTNRPPAPGPLQQITSEITGIPLEDVSQRKSNSPLPSRFHAVHLIGVAMDLGANRRGVDMGPSALRIAGLQQAIEALQITVEDRGNIPIALKELSDPGDPRQRYLLEIATAAADLASEVKRSLTENGLPI